MIRRARLTPQPTDTRLARRVARIVTFVSVVAPRWARRNLVPVRRGTYDDLNAERARLARTNGDLHHENFHLRNDLRHLSIQKLRLPTPRVDWSRLTFDPHRASREMEQRLSVQFEPLNICFALPRTSVIGRDLHDVTRSILKEQAHDLAYLHLERLANEIVEVAFPALPKPGATSF